jgi:hypothetical protein
MTSIARATSASAAARCAGAAGRSSTRSASATASATLANPRTRAADPSAWSRRRSACLRSASLGSSVKARSTARTTSSRRGRLAANSARAPVNRVGSSSRAGGDPAMPPDYHRPGAAPSERRGGGNCGLGEGRTRDRPGAALGVAQRAGGELKSPPGATWEHPCTDRRLPPTLPARDTLHHRLGAPAPKTFANPRIIP